MKTLHNLPPARIVYIDDNPVDIAIVKAVFNEPPYQVYTATKGEQGLKILGEITADIILLDIMLPAVDGYNLCKLIRTDEKHKFVKIILVSGQDAIAERLAGYAAGADDYLSKPFNNEELKAKIKVFLRLIQTEKELMQLNTSLAEKVELRSKQLVQSEKLASLGQLSAGIAHEINNPISFLISNLRTLNDYAGTLKTLIALYDNLNKISPVAQNPQISECQAQIKTLRETASMDYILSDLNSLIKESLDGAHRVQEIVAGLKTFARTDTAEIREADLNEEIKLALRLVDSAIKYKCTVETDFGEIPAIYCYPQQLNQVLVNLLINAAQAMPQTGEIKIITQANAQHITIKVSDTGSGIAAENVDKIFDPFFTTKPVGTGTGIGLAISYGIIQKHHGNIHVDSAVGKGTTFTITLPIKGLAEHE